MAENDAPNGQSGGRLPGFDPSAIEPFIVKDPEALTVNIARSLENLGKAASEWLGPRESGKKVDFASEPMTDIVRTLSKVVEYWLADPSRTLSDIRGRRPVLVSCPSRLSRL